MDIQSLLRTSPLNDPTTLCQALGMDLKSAQRQTSGLTVICPRHGGLSCSVTLAGGTVRVRCFGCDLAGDALVLIAAACGLEGDFLAVLGRAEEMCGGKLAPWADTRPPPKAPDPPAISDEDYDRIWTMALGACDIEPIKPFLESRRIFADAQAAGITSWSDRALEAVKDFSPELIELARVRDLRGYPVIIPWRDAFVRIQAVQRRCIGDSGKDRDGRPMPKYMWGKGRAAKQPYGVEWLRECPGEKVVIVEGALDTLARRKLRRDMREPGALVIGISSASSPLTGLPDMSGRDVVIAVDDDEAGKKAAMALRGVLVGKARSVLWEVPGNGAKDWGERLVSLGSMSGNFRKET